MARTPGRTCAWKCEASRPTAYVDASRSALATISPPFRTPSMPPSALELKHSSLVTAVNFVPAWRIGAALQQPSLAARVALRRTNPTLRRSSGIKALRALYYARAARPMAGGGVCATNNGTSSGAKSIGSPPLPWQRNFGGGDLGDARSAHGGGWLRAL